MSTDHFIRTTDRPKRVRFFIANNVTDQFLLDKVIAILCPGGQRLPRLLSPQLAQELETLYEEDFRTRHRVTDEARLRSRMGHIRGFLRKATGHIIEWESH